MAIHSNQIKDFDEKVQAAMQGATLSLDELTVVSAFILISDTGNKKFLVRIDDEGTMYQQEIVEP